MASIRKLKNKWIAEVRTKGKYRSKLHGSKAEAKAWADAQELQFGKKDGVVEGVTFAQAMRRYAREISPGKKGARWEMIRLEKFERDDLATILLTDLRTGDIEDWIKRQKAAGLKGSSINREMHLLSAVLNKSRRWKWLEGNPMTDAERPTNPPSRNKIYSDDQIKLILTALGYEGKVRTQRDRIAVAFLLAIETAMRQGEIWGLNAAHIDPEGRFAKLLDTKNGTSRDVPLSKKAVILIKSLNVASGKLFSMPQASAGVIFRRSLKLAGIEGYTFHDTRHTATTRLAKKLDMLTLARVVGHKDPRNLMIYFNPTVSDIADKLD